MARAKKEQTVEISIVNIKQGTARCRILGKTPLVYNSILQKGLPDLLIPPRKKTKIDKETQPKHDVLREFRLSTYADKNPDAPTYLYAPGAWFKQAMVHAALDIPGSATKAQMGRLTRVEPDRVAIYGVPMLYMTYVRSADMNRTPDARCRAIVPEWACEVEVSFTLPMVKEQMALSLLAAAGTICGVGDGRPQKGKLDFGRFELVDSTDADWKRIVKAGGRAAQAAAMSDDDPPCYDDLTRDLWEWYKSEMKRREMKGVA